MSETNTPTSASLLIDALTPKQRAFLFEALNTANAVVEITLNDHISTNTNNDGAAKRVTDFCKWSIKETKELRQLLFADCFKDDLQLLQFFTKEFPPLPSLPKNTDNKFL